ncbi:MAG: metallophosphoesterase family protein [Promethearchaeota archaeon]
MNAKSNRERQGNTFLINPNLGHPLILNTDYKVSKTQFEMELIFISDIPEPKEFEKFLKEKIQFIPIFENRWKLLKEKAIVKEKKKFWKRIKELFTLKKKGRKQEEKAIQGKQDYRRIKILTYRGEPIKGTILRVNNFPPNEIFERENLEILNSQDYLLKQHIFEESSKFYRVIIDFTLSEETLDWLKEYVFLMFDIIQKRENYEDRVNNHSLVISKNDWKNINFVHATDLHLAERNDRIYEIVKNWLAIQENVIEFSQKSFSKILFFKKRSKKKSESHTQSPKKIEPLYKRFINPNNNFRKFIRLMNKKVLRNELDFIVITGDLIDYSILSKLPKDLKKLIDFDYMHSNWRIFKELILDTPQKKRRGMIEGEELLCPIFTTTGNHDYRPYHYDIRWGNLYRKIGLNANEAIALNDMLAANPISSITRSFRALKAYFSEFNSSLNYSLKLGNSIFIFIDTGPDSFKNLRDFVSGHPSVTGITSRQIKFLEYIINNKVEENDNTFLFTHAPPINIQKKLSIFDRIALKKSKNDFIEKFDDFKESVTKKLGKTPKQARIDLNFNVKYGTVSANWEKLINFCKNHCILTLSGHTHELKEFRLEDADIKTHVLNAPPFSLKKIENPAAIYYDLYSEIYTNSKDIEANAPFLVQTPALGLGGYSNPKLTGAFREIKIVEGKLESFKLSFIKKGK